MEARIKATGEVVDVAYICIKHLTNRIVGVYEEINKTTSARTFTEDEIDFNINTIDWEQRRYEIARETLANYWNDGKDHDTDEAVATSIAIADEMIKQLKESEKIE